MIVCSAACSSSASPGRQRAQFGPSADISISLGEEYTEHAKPRGKKTATAAESGESFGRAALLYFPNRLLDLADVFRADVGVGLGTGAVLRLTKWGQIGYRDFHPLSVRLGLRGRRTPFFIERTAELGAGPGFLGSRERRTTPGEVGVGLDLLVVGAYLGVCFDELADFGAGLFGFDISDDDFR